MRILFAIPHFFDGRGGIDVDGKWHGSLAKDPQPRIEALTSCIASVHQLFGGLQRIIEHWSGRLRPVNQLLAASVDVVICTSGDRHLLGALDIDERYYTHHSTEADPVLLGFECQAVLRERLGAYDYYCYLEDDLILHDPWFFAKLAWFTNHAGPACLLQPHRFEVGRNYLLEKIYVDGDVFAAITRPFQDVHDSPSLSGEFAGLGVNFTRTTNPHAGCYFLHAEQMARWAAQPHFLDRNTSFIGPLESAASLGIMRTFKVYKPAPAQASFLELQHYGTAYLGLARPAGPAEGYETG